METKCSLSWPQKLNASLYAEDDHLTLSAGVSKVVSVF
jgi:hypothetical protein